MSKLIEKRLPPDDPRQRRPAIAEARKQPGWDPTTALREGLARRTKYFENRIGAGTGDR